MDPSNQDIATAKALMAAFAARTGLTPDAAPERYLWTDAFAACNFRALAESGAEPAFAGLALRTVEQVHRELGRHRADDSRSGWLHGPHGTASAEHPTRGGLRIGKPLPERGPGEPFDERLEWERDGQYFHYLTRWMHALDQLARATASPHLNLWARELADTAHRAFTHSAADGSRRMAWKMSIDLSRPLVPSMGQHDPLDGYVTVLALQRTAAAFGATEGPDLHEAAADYAAMLRHGGWGTTDPLGLGGLLMDAHRLEQIMVRPGPIEAAVLEKMLESALAGLRRYHPQLQLPVESRLGFRELGLSIGLAAVERMSQAVDQGRFSGGAAAERLLGELRGFSALRSQIHESWLQPASQRAASWTGHRNINEVMLATSLVPDGWLTRPPLDR